MQGTKSGEFKRDVNDKIILEYNFLFHIFLLELLHAMNFVGLVVVYVLNNVLCC